MRNAQCVMKFALEHPRFIVRDVRSSGRVKYLSLTDIKKGDEIYIRTVTAVVEDNTVVTWFARRTINDILEEGDVLYDAGNNNLQV